METFSFELIQLGSAGLLLALFLGTFVSEDLACISAGSLIAAEMIDPVSAILACMTGIVVGDLLLFAAGRLFGTRIRESRLGARFITPPTVKRATDWLSSRGPSAIVISRFLSGLRLPVYFLSGVAGFDAKRFLLFVTVAAAIWTPAVITLAAFWNMTVPLGAIGAVVVFFLLFRFGFRLTDRRRRRMLAGRIKRIWNWEFWPLWLFYFPVFVYVLYLAIRFRGFVFTGANPGMPAGGFVGESKDEIYKLIARSAGASRLLLPHIRIERNHPFEARYRRAKEFIETNELSYPVVVKPDAGERGNGVTIVRNETKLKAVLRDAIADVLLQEYVDGVEASVFYYRFPNEARGRIFSITEKLFPTVGGDGVSNLEDLILNDRRAHIIAEGYFKRNESRLQSVPETGEVVSLVDIGTHSKGAIFRDGDWLRTDALEAAVDSLASKIPGFYFGRFDLRATGFDELQAGRFRIIELNGVTSESTNIYDPEFSLADAYRILFRQWRIAFEIGAANESTGSRRSTATDLISLYLKSRRLA